MKDLPPVVSARSAGGVVWRRNGGKVEIAVCTRFAEHRSSLPKGTPEPGEEALATAIREVQEETGLIVTPGPSLGSTHYWFRADGSRIHKTVRWWLMRAVGGDVANHDGEFDAVEWVPAPEAVARLSYPDERNIVEKALDRIELGQVE
jgi:8-oxo-(d)GTP phosphatase